jgi:peptide/nickel transport system substrate-binding protein
MVVAMLVVGAMPALAQGPEGGIVVEGTFGGDPATFNPLLCTETACQRIIDLIMPKTLGTDPSTATFARVGDNDRVRNALVTDWQISEDGTIYTLTFRQDWNWSDGTPITVHDYKFAWDAIVSGQIDTNLGYAQDVIADVQVIDDYTMEITLHEPDCNALLYIGFVNPVPRHIFGEDFTTFDDNPWNFAPDVTAGPFSFGQMRPSEFVSVIADENYPDASMGYVNSEGFIYKFVPDATVLVEQFLAGETQVLDNPAVERRSDIRAAGDAGEAMVYPYPGNRWDYLTWNLANPANPQNGLDENGEVIEQDPHPLFGDNRVRHALALAVDVDDIIEGAVFGEGEVMPSSVIPASWAYDAELDPIGFDVDAAIEMLAEAGWVDEDGDGVLGSPRRDVRRRRHPVQLHAVHQ